MTETVRVGIDIGGTFTDVVLLDDATGNVRITKLPSTPSNPSVGFLRGVDWALAADGVSADALRYLVHGTTVATNAIIEGKAARTALLVTRGFRDILEIARQTRPDLFDLFVDKPAPLVPRDRVIEIRERRGRDGEIIEPLAESDVLRAAEAIVDEGIEAVAVCFLHAYAYPEHERRAGELLRSRLPDVAISLSSEVLPQFGEYLRASTTVVNAALLPIVGAYLDSIHAGLREQALDIASEGRDHPNLTADRGSGSRTGFYVMQSNGGVVSSAMARQRPVYIVESGPAAGVTAATQLARHGGYGDVISFDMGGTTAKAAMVQGGQTRLSPEIEVGTMASAGRGITRGRGYPIGTPALDLVEVGAGGGSIAWIDSGGLLRVGPRSAGADPGPACYGQGGTEPTVTDANLVLGRLDPGYFLGGAMRLDAEAAHRAIERVAAPLGVGVVETAAAIVDIAVTSMVHAVSLVTTERGYDVRDFTLVAFGGAGPLHANALAAELGIRRTVIPPGPGIFSALGLLVSDVEHNFVVSRLTPFGAIAHDMIEEIFTLFEARGRAALSGDGVPWDRMVFIREMDVRYVGQSFSLRIGVPDGPFGSEHEAAVRVAFYDEHERSYGYAARGEPIELVNVRLTAVGRTPKPASRRLAPQEGAPAPRAHRPVHFAESGFVECPVYDRYQLGAGARIAGPAIADELDSTVVLFPDYEATVAEDGSLVIERG